MSKTVVFIHFSFVMLALENCPKVVDIFLCTGVWKNSYTFTATVMAMSLGLSLNLVQTRS